MSFTPLKKLLPDIQSKRLALQRIDEAPRGVTPEFFHSPDSSETKENKQIFSMFARAMAEIYKDNAHQEIQPLYYKNGTLVCAGLSMPRATFLPLKEKEIVDMVNARIGAEVLRQIRCLG